MEAVLNCTATFVPLCLNVLYIIWINSHTIHLSSFLTPDWYFVMMLGSASELKTTEFFPIAVFCF